MKREWRREYGYVVFVRNCKIKVFFDEAIDYGNVNRLSVFRFRIYK